MTCSSFVGWVQVKRSEVLRVHMGIQLFFSHRLRDVLQPVLTGSEEIQWLAVSHVERIPARKSQYRWPNSVSEQQPYTEGS